MARGNFPSAKQDQFVLRFPDGMRGWLKAAADLQGRSMNAEIIARLEESINVWPEQLLRYQKGQKTAQDEIKLMGGINAGLVDQNNKLKEQLLLAEERIEKKLDAILSLLSEK